MTQDFLSWILTSGGAISLTSFLIERVIAWKLLDANLKFGASIAVSVLISILAKLAMNYIPVEVFTAVNPYLAIVVPILSAYGIGQAWHSAQKIVATPKDPSDGAAG